MIDAVRRLTGIAVLATLTLTAGAAQAQSERPNMDALVQDYLVAKAQREGVEAIVKDYLASHPEQVQRIVKDYLGKNPEILQDALNELVKRRAPAAPSNGERVAAVKANADAIFASTRQVNLGNPQGNVTMVEFFDYNCGYCKRALSDMVELIKSDPKLKIVLKELPVLGPGSLEAARVAIAVRMQDPTGHRYLDFHQRLLGARGQANRMQALTAAKEAGLDVARIERDMGSDEVSATLDESSKLARALGINGTPSYVIGDNVVVGAVGLANLTAQIETARK